MRLHAEIKMIGGDSSFRPWRWLLVSLAGFMFWSALIAAVRQVVVLML